MAIMLLLFAALTTLPLLATVHQANLTQADIDQANAQAPAFSFLLEAPSPYESVLTISPKPAPHRALRVHIQKDYVRGSHALIKQTISVYKHNHALCAHTPKDDDRGSHGLTEQTASADKHYREKQVKALQMEVSYDTPSQDKDLPSCLVSFYRHIPPHPHTQAPLFESLYRYNQNEDVKNTSLQIITSPFCHQAVLQFDLPNPQKHNVTADISLTLDLNEEPFPTFVIALTTRRSGVSFPATFRQSTIRYAERHTALLSPPAEIIICP